MKKYLSLRADASDFKEIFRDVLKEEKVLTKGDLVNIPTIKEIEKTLESYPTKVELKQELEKLKQELTSSLIPIATEIKKLRRDLMIAGILSPSSTL